MNFEGIILRGCTKQSPQRLALFLTPGCCLSWASVCQSLFDSKSLFTKSGSLLDMDCIGLAAEWEANVELRTRVREEKRILTHAESDKYCKPNRPNAVNNRIALMPILQRLQRTPQRSLPHLEDLTNEVTTLLQKCGVGVGEKLAYKTSVELKKLAGFVKRRSGRKEVTKERGQG